MNDVHYVIVITYLYNIKSLDTSNYKSSIKKYGGMLRIYLSIEEMSDTAYPQRVLDMRTRERSADHMTLKYYTLRAARVRHDII